MHLPILRDAALTVTRSLPAQNSTLASSPIELGTNRDGFLHAEVAVDRLPNLADGQTITVGFQDSADGVTYAALSTEDNPYIPPPAVVLTGAGGAGAAQVNKRIYIPPTVRKYVRLSVSASASAGDNTAATASLGILG